jgi:hypothetical protein
VFDEGFLDVAALWLRRRGSVVRLASPDALRKTGATMCWVSLARTRLDLVRGMDGEHVHLEENEEDGLAGVDGGLKRDLSCGSRPWCPAVHFGWCWCARERE